MVARHGRLAAIEPFGCRDLASGTHMTKDTIFAIASVTRPITCAAVMTLVEEGKLGLDYPVARYLPELKALRVLGDSKDDFGTDGAIVPANRPVSVRDLLAHTSGFAGSGSLSTNVRLWRPCDRVGVQDRDLKAIADQVARLAQVPLPHQPGEGQTYGLSHDLLGRLFEIISGRGFDVDLRERIFRPLDLHDSAFHVPEGKRERVATIDRAVSRGKLVPISKNHGSETLFSGDGGPFSTARDRSQFAQMLLNGDELEGAWLKPETIAPMTPNQIGEHHALERFKYGPGFGLELAHGPDGGEPVPDRYFWGGIFSTYSWADSRRDLIAVLKAGPANEFQ